MDVRLKAIRRLNRSSSEWNWPGRRDSNPQPSVPKTDALSIELRPGEIEIVPEMSEVREQGSEIREIFYLGGICWVDYQSVG